jgi:hypothetical protein
MEIPVEDSQQIAEAAEDWTAAEILRWGFERWHLHTRE